MFQGSISLNGVNANTNLPEQMTDDWIINVLGRMDNGPNAFQDTRDLIIEYKAAGNKIAKFFAAIDKTNGHYIIVNYGEVSKAL